MSRAVFQKWAADPQLVVIDTETTGLHGEAIEIAVVDATGRVLFDERVKPTCPIEPGARAVHGITDGMLATAPTIAELWPRLREVLAGGTVVTYNADFDSRIVLATLDARSVSLHPHEHAAIRVGWSCAMQAYARVVSSRRWVRLTDACALERVNVSDLAHAHSAAGDALRTLRLIQAVGRRA